MKIFLLLLLGAEIAHLLLHLRVLCCIGQPYTENEYRKKKLYFTLDMATVLGSYLLYLQNNILLSSMVFFHFALHVFYIAKWKDQGSFFVDSIIKWSTQKSHKERIAVHGSPMYIYNTLGTTFYILTHLLIILHLHNAIFSH